MKRAVFFVLLLALEPSAFSQNLIMNPGFETWVKINKPSGWTTAQNCLKDSINVNSGNYSSLHSGGTTTTSYLGQTINVLPGKEYRLLLYYKTGINTTGKGSRIWCYWKDIEDKSISDVLTDDIMRPSQYLKSDTWQEFSIRVIAPPAAVAFYLEVRTNSNSTVYWDDLRFEESVATFRPEEKFSDILIYPNPASNYLVISNLQNIQHIDIQDLTGKNIFSSDFSGEQTVSITVSGFRDGLYIIRMRSSDKVITRKFIKKSN